MKSLPSLGAITSRVQTLTSKIHMPDLSKVTNRLPNVDLKGSGDAFVSTLKQHRGAAGVGLLAAAAGTLAAVTGKLPSMPELPNIFNRG